MRVSSQLVAAAAIALSLVAAVVFTPEPAFTAEAGLAGWPRLGLYALAGIVLGLTAPAACMTRKLHNIGAEPPRAYLVLSIGLAAAIAITLVNALRLRTNMPDPLGPFLWAAAMLV